MSRSRAVNRSNRFIAKRRRRALRSVVPGLREDLSQEIKSIDHSEQLQKKLSDKEVLLELLEPDERV